MDGSRQGRPNEGPILNFNNFNRQSLNKSFGTRVEKSIVFKALKKCISVNHQVNIVSFLEIKLLA